MKKYNHILKFWGTICLMIVGLASFGQEAGAVASTPAAPAYQITLATIIYVFAFILIMIAIAVWRISVHVRQYMRNEFPTEKVGVQRQSTWEKLFQIKSTATDKDTMIDHPHDGIYELDNPAPPWFMFLFYGTIAFAVIYYVRFTFTESGYTQAEEYAQEMKLAEGAQLTRLATSTNKVDENSVVYLTTAADLEKGKAIFDGNCKICHGDYGQGAVGPNFTDNYYIHGGSIKDIFKVIKYGVVEKGMISWESQLGAESMQLVASYIKSLNGTTPPVKGKEPQGELYEEKAEANNSETVESDAEPSDSISK